MLKNNQIIKKGFDIENPMDDEGGSGKRQRFSEKENFLREEGKALWIIISLILGVLLIRTAFLQVVQGNHYREVSEKNRIRSTLIKAPRGIIRDREGEVLARNVPSFDVVFVPAHLSPSRKERQLLLKRLENILDLEEAIKNEILSSDPKDKETYLIEAGIETEKALQAVELESELLGVYITQSAKREYVDGKIFSQVIGYEGKVTEEELKRKPQYSLIDNVGKIGLEQVYEEELHGEHGRHRFEVDSRNNIKQDLGIINPVGGNKLKLHLDAGLQKRIFQSLNEVLEENEDATGGAAVILDPRDGAVRALVSVPSFDNNLFVGGIAQEEYSRLSQDSKKPLLNRVILGEYPPGSTFKLIMAAAALEENVISENETIDCHGGISIGQWSFPDWKTHGLTDVKKAIAESCNVFFYAVGGGYGGIFGLGDNQMRHYAEMFGLGEETGIDLSGEQQGFIPDENWKFKTFGEKWYIGDSYHMAIGQGYVTVTPLQMALSTMAIANGGIIWQPQIVDKIINSKTGEEKKNEQKKLNKVFVSADNLRIVREGMRQAVTGDHGSGRLLNSLEVSSAGKTGTAQFGTDDKTHSWYVSFAPYEDPELVMAVLIEGGGGGHDWAVPVTKEAYQWYFDYERGDKIPEEVEEVNREINN